MKIKLIYIYNSLLYNFFIISQMNCILFAIIIYYLVLIH